MPAVRIQIPQVSVTANCANVSAVSALAIGGIGGFLLLLGMEFELAFKIDDPVGAFPVHGIAGMWGVIATALFDSGLLADGTPGEPVDIGVQVEESGRGPSGAATSS